MSEVSGNRDGAPAYDLIVVGDQVVIGDAVRAAGIAIAGERIAALLDVDDARRPGLAARTIDATGKVVLPGPIDAHVHHRTLNDTADSWESLTRGAALGGVTTIIPYIPHCPPMSLGETLEYFRDEGERESVVDFAMHCRLGGPTDDVFEQIPEAFAVGVPSFKMFLAYRKRGIMWDGPPLMRALETIGGLGGIWCCHAENGDLIDFLEDRYIARGAYTADTYLATRPHAAEVEAAFRAIQVAGALDCRLYLVHTSVAGVLPLAADARRAGQRVVVETCPQYLTLTDETTRRNGGRAKIAPPMRHPEDNDALWHGLAHGDVQVVASDHAPGPPDKKRYPPERFGEISYGAPGVETILPLLYSEGVAKGRITLPRLAEVLSGAPARVFGLSPRKGGIAPGADADLVVIDPDLRWRIDERTLQSEAGYSNWDGWELQGKPVLSLLRGQILLDGEDLRQGLGYGRYLAREALSDEGAAPTPAGGGAS
jgi:dihydropyrimidinase